MSNLNSLHTHRESKTSYLSKELVYDCTEGIVLNTRQYHYRNKVNIG